MATKSCADGCRTGAQKLDIYFPPPKKFIVTGNWKMNGDKESAEKMIKMLRSSTIRQENEVVVGVPAPYLDYIEQRIEKMIDLAAQNIYKESKGPYTGEISADMLVDIGVKWVILGASERRIYFNEDYDLIGEKAKYAIEKDLKPIICIGETEEERKKEQHINAVINQLKTIMNYVPKSKWRWLVFVYEPLWSTETGRAITLEEAKEMVKAIRRWVTDKIERNSAHYLRILIGGPLTIPAAREFASHKDFDGLYVGMPSLKKEFISFINANSTIHQYHGV